MRRAALYARVSTSDQRCAVQLEALRRYAADRQLAAIEFIDEGVSGAKEQRPALDQLLDAVRRRHVDAVVCTKLDRLFRSVRHLVVHVGEFQALGVDLVVLDQAIDTSTPVGRLMFHVLAAIAEFERDLIRERVIAGVRRAQLRGTKSGRCIGRPRKLWLDAEQISELVAAGLSMTAIAKRLGAHPTQVKRILVKHLEGGLTNPGAQGVSNLGQVVPLSVPNAPPSQGGAL